MLGAPLRGRLSLNSGPKSSLCLFLGPCLANSCSEGNDAPLGRLLSSGLAASDSRSYSALGTPSALGTICRGAEKRMGGLHRGGPGDTYGHASLVPAWRGAADHGGGAHGRVARVWTGTAGVNV